MRPARDHVIAAAVAFRQGDIDDAELLQVVDAIFEQWPDVREARVLLVQVVADHPESESVAALAAWLLK